MIKTTSDFLKEINKLGGRKFVSKVLIRDKEYNDDNIIDMSLNESVNPGDNFSLGSVVSNTFEINLINVDDIFENAVVKPYIGLEIDNEIEYIPLGVFIVDEVSKKDKKVKLQCVDNMFNLERAYFSDLSYPANINEVLKEICTKAKIICNSILPNYSIDEIKGYSFRQAIGIIATLAGCFARFNRLGELEILSYEDTDLRITPDIFFKFETNDKDYIIGKITAKKGEKTFSKGANTEIIIDNPVITESIVNDLYNKFKDFTYRPYTLSWQGNPAVQAGDRVTIVGIDSKEYNTLIMNHKLTYSGGITSELKATGKTESSDKFDSKGPIAQAMENYSIEQANIKKALIEKADIDSLNAIDARINNLYTQDLTALKANIKELQSNKISTVEFNATKAEIQTAIISKADINLVNAQGAKINTLEVKTASIDNLLAGNLTAKNFHAGAITAGSAIIAENAIGSSQISSLSVNKVEAGDISTSKFRIISANGSIQIVGNQLLVNRDNINRVVLGEYRKQDNTTDYGLLIRAKDGKTIMLDGEGVHNAGITDGAIDNNKVSDNANINGNKLDINSVIREVNNKGTETIKGTKVQVGDRTLDIELSTQNNTITEHSKELSNQKATIQALDNAIKLKVDNQTFTQSTDTIKDNINSLNSDLVNKIDTSLNNAKADATNKANNALNSAKEFTTSQITTTNSNLSKATSEINILKEQINTKVGQVDIDRSIQDIKFNDANMLFNSANFKDTSHWGYSNSRNNTVNPLSIENNILKFKFSNYANWGCYLSNNSLKDKSLDITKKYTVVCKLKASKNQTVGFNICDGDYGNLVFSKDLNITTEWKIFKFTFKPASAGNERQFRFITGNLGYEFDLYIEFVKMVEGATSSDVWTSNPLEVNQTIVDNIKVVTDKINDVSTKFIQAKDSLQASVNSLNSTTQTITTNITNTTNDLSNKITIAKNDAINSSNYYTNTAKQQAIDTANSHANNIAETKKNEAIIDARKIPDTRNDNQNPDWYIKNYARQTITEFKLANIIKIPNGGSVYGTLETKVPWGDSSGGYPTQIFRSNSYPTYQRHGISNTAWSSWEQIEDTQGSQAKANNALSSANAYTTAQITTVNTRVSNAESSINVLKNQISTKVSQSDIDKTVNNIKIGGRNYGLDTGKMLETVYNVSFSSKLVFQKNKTYTLALDFDAENLVAGSQARIGCEFSIGFSDGSRSYYGVWHYINDGTSFKGRKYVTFTIPNLDITDAPTGCRIYPDLVSSGKRFLGNFKLEEGNKPTDWTPAPEDIGQEIKDNITTVTEKINTVESTLTQKTNNINAAVGSVQSILNTKADGSTVSSIQSQLASLNIGVDGIRAEVAKKTDKDNIISAINQSAEEIKIDASRIKINGLTTFASKTGLKAIEIESNNILFYDWEGSERKEPVGKLYSTRSNGDVNKPGLAIGHEENSMFDIVYKQGDTYLSYIGFDKYKAACPITLFEDINLNGCLMYLSSKKINSIYESTSDTFCIETKHGLNVFDKDSKATIANLGSSRVGFSKWDQKYYYAEFFPDGFSLGNGRGKSYFWVKADESTIWTAGGVSMGIQGNLTVSGKKNRVVETSIGNLALNALESTECWFTDCRIEQDRTDANGDCIIWFDSKFLLTVNTRYRYKIDVTPIGEFASNGKLTYVRVVEKTEKYFKVRGTPNTLFDWTITAKQVGYERDRLEKVEKAS